MTDEERDALREKLDGLAAAEQSIYDAMKPYRAALTALEATRDMLLAGIDADITGKCESCSKLLFTGEPGHRCADDPILCETCSPTWADMQRQAQEIFTSPDADSDQVELATRNLEAVQAHLEAGGSLEDKNVSPL